MRLFTHSESCACTLHSRASVVAIPTSNRIWDRALEATFQANSPTPMIREIVLKLTATGPCPRDVEVDGFGQMCMSSSLRN